MNRHFKNAQELGQGLRRGFDDQTNIYLNNVTSSPHTSPSETYFVLYEIGRPDIWSNAQIQLYEKVTTFEGKTMWNDLTQQGPVSVSTVDPIWKNNDLSVRYRTKDFINREEFELPAGSLCLVLPLMKQSIYLKGNGDIGKFVIVPIDDVIVVKSQKESGRDELNNADLDTSIKNKRHVIIRTSRALMGGSMADLDIVERGSDRYLKLPHRLPHHAQLDLETRADENKLIIPGSSARLTSIVSDTRKLRSTLYLQVTNTGLAPAYFSLTTRDCNPRLDFNENEAVTLDTEKCLIPPMHTKKFTMELPLEKSFEDYTCTTDDPKLLCRNMPELEQVAAGISTLESPRRTRSACYPDTVSINIFVVFIGVLLMLIIFGIIKAILGLFLPCVGSWGLEFVLKVPRKLDRYYESSLKCRTVAYDKDGWPVHPDTKKRSVLLVSKYMEFILNVLMFVILPCVILWDAINQLIFKCQNVADEKVGADVRHSSSRKCFSTQNMQTSEPRWRRRTGGMRKWMTPQAEELSTDIWQYGLSPTGAVGSSMQPLLTETTKRGGTIEKPACQIDSEQDDTEYVLMQMQKSKESLAIQ
ncbi:unnamed protein product [Leptosia nina]|uniref:Generative cell specific-1/HAP2 domain-containing protein n=1 Tax=Leptosia nina TaxID=320188 RepID=A0AAV1JJQ5_9NEOP